jgi:gliding motility-associated-like protein
MRAVILLLLTAASISAATAQQITSRPPNRNQTAAEFVRRDRLHLPGHFGTRRDPDSGVRVNVRTFTSPQLLNEFIRLNQSQLSAAPVPPNPTGHLPPPNPTAHPTSLVRPTTRVAAKSRSTGSRTLGATCANHAFFELIGLTNSVVYAGAMTHTRDDGVVISGSIYDSTAAEPSWQINAYILKCDNLGNILWVNLLVDPNNDPSYDFEPLTLKEMPAGDLVLAAMVSDDPTGNNSEVTSIYHLTAAGATLWHKELKSTGTPTVETYVTVKDINPGLNGDFILSGTTVAVNGGQGLTVVRLDANGNYIWEVILTNGAGDYNLGAEGLNAYLSGSQIMALGLSHGDEFPYGNDAIIFATLDYATGDVLNKRFWVHSTAIFSKTPQYYLNYAVQLNNGNYLVYYMPFSAFMQATDTVDYVGVEEYDPTGTFLNGYTLSAVFYTPYLNNMVWFDNNDNGFLSIPSPVNGSAEAVFYATIRNDRIVRQRILNYTNNISSDYNSTVRFMNDGAYMVSTNYYDPASGVWLGLKKLYDTDTVSVCLGRDTAVLMKLPFTRLENPAYTFLDPPQTNQIVPVSYGIVPAPITYHTQNGCFVNSSCSLVQIQGPASACGAGQPMQYMAIRNPGCGAVPLWTIDTSAISSLTQLTDTTIAIIFKDSNWAGKLHADIPAGSCSTGLGDSISVTIQSSAQAPAPEADTTLCSGNSIVLHPGSVYTSYLWQDGTTDSTYTVTAPGLYSVAVTDACGNIYNASTQVIPANFPFTLGPALTKCNADTVTLKATGGFINYQWSISGIGQPALTDSTIAVDPLQTTTYAVTADKWAGCAVNSTVQVTVQTSPVIQLGMDTTFCSGGSRLLDAGPGFSIYAWNTGQTSEQITVNQAGSYEVVGTAANGCTSRDTFQVTAVYPDPQFSLGVAADSTICYNQSITYSFPADGSQYLWSDGRQGPDRLIDTAGTYGLTVVNSYGCSTSHSITIVVNPSPQLYLGADTTLCEGKDLVLNAATGTGNNSYLWQDGITSGLYTVTAAGIYTVRATAADGCSSIDSIQVSYTGVPAFNLGQDTALCPGMTFTLKPSLAFAGTYLWQDGSTQNFMLIQDTGTYSLTTSNTCGTSKGAIHVTAGLCTLVMPNAFTPNGDGRNDVFRVRYPFSVTHFVMAIYDRWGQQVFHSTNIDEGWDGTIHGSPAPTGTYVWFISLTDWQNKNQFQKGTVMLVR